MFNKRKNQGHTEAKFQWRKGVRMKNLVTVTYNFTNFFFNRNEINKFI